MDTLYQEIFRIEKSQEYATQELKDQEVRAKFEMWRKNPIVESVLSGKTTFSAEHQEFYAGITIKDFFIPYTIPQSYKEGFRDLESCLGRTGNMIEPGDFETLILNPLTVGLSGILGVARMAMNRREFLSKAKVIVTGTSLGLAIGSFFPFLSLADAVNMGDNAKYLDGVYARVKSPSKHKEALYLNRRDLFRYLTHRT